MFYGINCREGEDIMSVITISKGEEFKISIKDELREDDIFINEYQRGRTSAQRICWMKLQEHPCKRKVWEHPGPGSVGILKIISLHFAGNEGRVRAALC